MLKSAAGFWAMMLFCARFIPHNYATPLAVPFNPAAHPLAGMDRLGQVDLPEPAGPQLPKHLWWPRPGLPRQCRILHI